jgi:hypothetical protein
MRRIGLCALAASVLTLPVGAAPLPCDQLVPYYQSNNYNWWWGPLGHCKTGPGGITDASAIFECAWRQVQHDHRLACLHQHLDQAPITAQGIAVVAAYNARPTCPDLHVKYMQNNYSWWWGALGNCKTGPGGITNEHEIFRCAWRQVPSADRQECLRQALWAAPITHQGIAVVAAYNTPKACSQLTASYQANNFAWWRGALGACKTGPGGPSTHDQIFECAWAQVQPAAHQLRCLRELFENAPVTTQDIAEVRRHNSIVDSNGIPNSVADNMADVPLGGPEACDLPTDGTVPEVYLEPRMPPALVGGAEGRLRDDLREVARLAEPLRCSLPLAAERYTQADAATTALVRDAYLVEARAYADLAVTGRRSFERFREDPPRAAYCAAIATQPIASGCPALGMSQNPDELVEGCHHALDRAYQVANFLRAGQTLTAAGPWFDSAGNRTEAAEKEDKRKRDERRALGWIAVSGEDDLPHRPVNVPSSDWPQFEMDVEVEVPHKFLGIENGGNGRPLPERVHARYVVAQSRGAALSAPSVAPHTLAPDPEPWIPPFSDVLIYIHGMDSRAEESEAITRALFRQQAQGQSENPLILPRNLVIIAVDMPTSGYTETLNYDVVSPLSAIGHPDGVNDFSATGHTPLLDFLETFVVRFAEALDKKTPFLGNVKAVMGGSMGGNLSFRLGRRPNVSWLPNVIAWSPASIWESMAEGNDLSKHLAVRKAWFEASDRDPNDPLDLQSSRSDRRRAFFVDGWDKWIAGLIVPMSQPETWTSKAWPCRDSAIAASRLDRHETYDPEFQPWHWRLAAEQLIYSHITHEWSTGEPRYMANDKRMLIACGEEDDVSYNSICDSTWWTAGKMNQTPGRACLLRRTGHSLDGERPRYWAVEIAVFLGL